MTLVREAHYDSDPRSSSGVRQYELKQYSKLRRAAFPG